MARGEKKTGIIAVRLEPEIVAAIEREADKEDRPLASMTRILLKEAIAAREANEEGLSASEGIRGKAPGQKSKKR